MAVQLSKIDFFSTTRITRLVQTLANQLEINAPLTFLNRTPVVPVLDDLEILGSFSGPIFAADLITEDAEAVVVEGGKFEVTGGLSNIPKIKIGARVSESIIKRLSLLKRGIEISGDAELITGWELQFAQNLVTGVRQTMNYLCAGMMLDGVVYDRLGYKISSGFGTPSALKVALVDRQQWTSGNTSTMTPITNLQQMCQGVAPTLGKTYNRVTMATTTFQRIVVSDEFLERVRLLLRLEPTQFTLNMYDVANLQNLFVQVTGLQLELEDTTFRVRNTNGTSTVQRVLPENKVILSNTGDDNNSQAYDFANGIVAETITAPLIEGAPNFGGEQVGPVSYYTGNRELNPPDLRAWAVASGFPRKHDKLATAILTVF